MLQSLQSRGVKESVTLRGLRDSVEMVRQPEWLLSRLQWSVGGIAGVGVEHLSSACIT